jgi:hypothetical protein
MHFIFGKFNVDIVVIWKLYANTTICTLVICVSNALRLCVLADFWDVFSCVEMLDCSVLYQFMGRCVYQRLNVYGLVLCRYLG